MNKNKKLFILICSNSNLTLTKCNTIGLFFSKFVFLLFLRLLEKGTIYKHVSGNSKKCLHVDNFGTLYVVDCM